MPLTLIAMVGMIVLQADTGSSVEIARSYRIQSHTLVETRVIDVSLPASYGSDSTRRYPVLVVLDGDYEQQIAAAIARFYAETSQIPELLVVGVRNTNRGRDMTPALLPDFPLPPEIAAAGGADRFLAFLGDELLPYIDRRYRTAPLRVLVGHSLGGLLGIYALSHRPELFTGYILMEPSVWWNRGHEVDQAKAALREPAARHARVMMVNMESWGVDTTQWGSSGPMIRELSASGETHSSMPITGMTKGLRTLFADFKPAEWRPGTRPIAMLERYDSLSARVGYAVPIPPDAFALVTRMSLDSRHFDDAERVLARWERTLGATDESREFRQRWTRERLTPQPATFVPLEFPARRPTAQQAAAFVGHWVTVAQPDTHEVVIRVSGDTIVVHDRVQQRGIDWFGADDPVIQVTSDGTLEWGLPFFREIAALVVLRGKIESDGTMLVTRQVRGWVPRGAGPELNRTERLRRVTP
jgi:predicted alpha/beta superfamily hydrolase